MSDGSEDPTVHEVTPPPVESWAEALTAQLRALVEKVQQVADRATWDQKQIEELVDWAGKFKAALAELNKGMGVHADWSEDLSKWVISQERAIASLNAQLMAVTERMSVLEVFFKNVELTQALPRIRKLEQLHDFHDAEFRAAARKTIDQDRAIHNALMIGASLGKRLDVLEERVQALEQGSKAQNTLTIAIDTMAKLDMFSKSMIEQLNNIRTAMAESAGNLDRRIAALEDGKDG